MDQEKVNAVLEWSTPLKDLQRCLCFANFYRCLIKNYSIIAEPLTSPKKRGKKEIMMERQRWLFKDKSSLYLSTYLKLKHPNPEAQFILEDDASDTEVGAILSQ